MELEIETGLLEKFPEFREVVRASVYDCGRQLKAIAADLDMSSSELSRKLATNPTDPVHFPLDRLPELLAATRDLRPVYWLVEKFLEDSEMRRRRSIDSLARMLPEINRMLKDISRD